MGAAHDAGGSGNEANAMNAGNAAAAFFGAVGSYFDGQTRKEQYKTQQMISRYNAKMALKQAEDKISRMRRTEQRLRGSQIAAIGASGLSFDGSALEVIADSMFEFELDVAAVRKSAIISATNSTLSANTAGVNADIASASATLGLTSAASELALFAAENE